MVVDIGIFIAAIGFSSASAASLVLDQWALKRNEERLQGRRMEERVYLDDDDSFTTWVMIKWDGITNGCIRRNPDLRVPSSCASSSSLEDSVFAANSSVASELPNVDDLLLGLTDNEDNEIELAMLSENDLSDEDSGFKADDEGSKVEGNTLTSVDTPNDARQISSEELTPEPEFVPKQELPFETVEQMI